MDNISKIISGGQTGADRAALDFALKHGIEYGGWVPFGGWAEDHPTPPGLLADYPKLQETVLEQVEQRTTLNARDSDATVIMLLPGDNPSISPGTEKTLEILRMYGRPVLIIDPTAPGAMEEFRKFLKERPGRIVLNIAGPRESESKGLYAATLAFLEKSFGLVRE